MKTFHFHWLRIVSVFLLIFLFLGGLGERSLGQSSNVEAVAGSGSSSQSAAVSMGHGTSPSSPGSGGPDGDHDRMLNSWERNNGTDPTREDAGEDYDKDELTNLEEYEAGTYPWNPYSDGDDKKDGEDGFPLLTELKPARVPDRRYAVIDMEALGYNNSYQPQEINDKSQVLGSKVSSIPDGWGHSYDKYEAALWDPLDQTTTPVPILSVDSNYEESPLASHASKFLDSYASRYLNNQGIVCGVALSNNHPTPAIWSKAGGTTLLEPYHDVPGTITASEGVAWAMNDDGNVYGESYCASRLTDHNFWTSYGGILWSSQEVGIRYQTHYLPTAGDSDYTGEPIGPKYFNNGQHFGFGGWNLSLNNHKVIVGNGWSTPNGAGTLIYDGGVAYFDPNANLVDVNNAQVPAAVGTMKYGPANDWGVASIFKINGTWVKKRLKAPLWKDGDILGYASRINDAYEVVGSFNDADNSQWVSYLRNGIPVDLNKKVSGWTSVWARSINNLGVMAGSATKLDTNGQPTGGSKKVLLLPVELKLLSETKNKANQIYNPTQKDDPWGATLGYGANDQNGAPRNKLFLVPDPQGGKYKVTLEVEIPETFRTKFYAAAYVGDTKVANSDKVFDANGKCELEFEHLGTSNDIEDFAIRIGYDTNNSSTLDPGEITKLQVKSYGELIVRGTKASKYGSAKSNIDGIISGSLTSLGTDLILPNAKRFLQIFRDGNATGVPTERQPTSTTTMSFNAFNGYFWEWLTHNSGAPFSDEGASNITEYTWNQNTPAAEIIATSLQVQGEVRNFYITSVRSQAETFLAGKPVGTVTYFPSSTGFYDIPHLQESPSWVAPTTVTFHNFPEYMAMGDDVNGTIGRGRLLSHQARYKVEKQLVYYNPPDGSPTSAEELVITEVISQGVVSDLYDFNHLVGGAGQDAAILQIGFGKGAYGSDRDRGKIYRDKIEFNKTYPNLPTVLP